MLPDIMLPDLRKVSTLWLFRCASVLVKFCSPCTNKSEDKRKTSVVALLRKLYKKFKCWTVRMSTINIRRPATWIWGRWNHTQMFLTIKVMDAVHRTHCSIGGRNLHHLAVVNDVRPIVEIVWHKVRWPIVAYQQRFGLQPSMCSQKTLKFLVSSIGWKELKQVTVAANVGSSRWCSTEVLYNGQFQVLSGWYYGQRRDSASTRRSCWLIGHPGGSCDCYSCCKSWK